MDQLDSWIDTVVICMSFIVTLWWLRRRDNKETTAKASDNALPNSRICRPVSPATPITPTQAKGLPSVPSQGPPDPPKIFHEAVLTQPHKDPEVAILALFNLFASAQRTLRIATFSLVGQGIIDRLIEAVRRDVAVMVIVDKMEESLAEQLVKAGVQLRIFLESRAASRQRTRWQVEGRSALFHQKYVIVDEEFLQYGSCNLSEKSLRTHYEDFVTTNDPRFVQPFIAEFQARWTEFSK